MATNLAEGLGPEPLDPDEPEPRDADGLDEADGLGADGFDGLDRLDGLHLADAAASRTLADHRTGLASGRRQAQ